MIWFYLFLKGQMATAADDSGWVSTALLPNGFLWVQGSENTEPGKNRSSVRSVKFLQDSMWMCFTSWIVNGCLALHRLYNICHLIDSASASLHGLVTLQLLLFSICLTFWRLINYLQYIIILTKSSCSLFSCHFREICVFKEIQKPIIIQSWWNIVSRGTNNYYN